MIGIAIERDELAEQRRCALVEAETERVRSSLLSSVSHDLRTPLAVIAGDHQHAAGDGRRGGHAPPGMPF